MKTNKRFLLVASLALALAFTISCSDDDSLPSLLIACQIDDDPFYGKICIEEYGYGGDEYKNGLLEDCGWNGGHPIEKCSSDFANECPAEAEHLNQRTVYFYDKKFSKPMTCDEIFEIE
jgi:hypothetical protein